MTPEPLSALLVDDDPNQLDSLAILLQTVGLRVVTASCAAEALDALEHAAPIDVAVVDLALGGRDGAEENGIDLARMLKQKRPALEIILLTGAQDADQVKVLKSGIRTYMVKGRENDDVQLLQIQAAAREGLLNRLTGELLRTTDSEELRQRILAFANTLSGAVEASIALPRPDGGVELYPRPGASTLRFTCHYTDRRIIDLIIERGETIIEPDAQGNPAVHADVKACGITAFAGVPIGGPDQAAAAALYVYWRADRPDDFHATVALLQRLAGQAALGLVITERTRRESQEALQETSEKLDQLVESISSQIDLETMLQALATGVNEVVQGERAGVNFLLPEGAEEPWLPKRSSSDEDRYPSSNSPPRPHGITARVMDTGRPVREGNLRVSDLDSDNLRAGGIVSALAVPIRTAGSGRSLGVLLALGTAANLYRAEDEELLLKFAKRVAPVLERAKELQRISMQQDERARLDHLIAQLKPENEPYQLAQQIADYSGDQANADFVAVLGSEPGMAALALLETRGDPRGDPLLTLPVRLPPDKGLLAEAFDAARRFDRVDPGTDAAEVVIHAPVTLLALPLSHNDQRIGLIVAARRLGAEGTPFGEPEQARLAAFARRAAERWHECLIRGAAERASRRREDMEPLRRYIDRQTDLERVRRVLVTGVTAGFGLGYNRAALFELAEDGTTLQGVAGVGDLTAEAVRAAWRRTRAGEKDTLDAYIADEEANKTGTSALRTIVPTLRFARGAAGAEILWRVCDERRYELLERAEDLERLPADLRTAINPGLPTALFSVDYAGRAVGLLVVDNLATRTAITRERRHDLDDWLEVASPALVRARARQNEAAIHKEMTLVERELTDVASDPEKKEYLERAAEIARRFANADGVTILRIQGETVVDLGTSGIRWKADEIMRKGANPGLTLRVMASGNREVVYDASAAPDRERANPSWQARGICAGVCEPMLHDGVAVGVIWFHYCSAQSFAGTSVERFRALAVHIERLWNLHRRAQRQAALNRLAVELAPSRSEEELLRAVVREARTYLDCAWCAYWPFEPEATVWRVEDACVSEGVDAQAWRENAPTTLTPGPVARRILAEGLLCVPDIASPPEGHALKNAADAWLRGQGVRSWLGVALKSWDQRREQVVSIGVLFLNYNAPRDFSELDKADAVRFGERMGNIIYVRSLLAQLQQWDELSDTAVKWIIQGDSLTQKLKVIADSTRSFFNCANVVLYVRQAEDTLSEPVTAGEVHEDALWPGGRVDPEWAMYGFLRDTKLHFLRRGESPLANSTFADAHNLQAVTVAPLVAEGQDQAFALLFINYDTHHTFTGYEKQITGRLANIVAAIMSLYRAGEELSEHRRIEEKTRETVGSTDPNAFLEALSTIYYHRVNNACRLINQGVGQLRAVPGPNVADRHTALLNIEKSSHELSSLGFFQPRDAASKFKRIAIRRELADYVEDWRRKEAEKVSEARQNGQERPHIELTLSSAISDELSIFSSKEMIREVLVGLTGNARNALKEHAKSHPQVAPRIEIVAEQRGDRLHILIRDNGPGFKEEDLPRAFRGSFQDPDHPTRGYGLWVIDRIVRGVLGGDRSARNHPEGGAELEVILPCTIEPGAGHEPETIAGDATQGAAQ